MTSNKQMRNRKVSWGLLGISMAVAFFAFAYPMYVIRPFRAQGPSELALALLVKRWALLLGLSALAIALSCVFLLWRDATRIWTRVFCGAATLLTVLFAALTQINVYEMMFHRIDTPESIPANEAKLERGDMVLAVRVEGYARAYPIRMMAYHHIVNDRVGSTPIVATY